MSLELTDRQKVGHLLRRFGFGASLKEMEVYGDMKPKDVMAKLLDFGDEKDLGDPMRWAFVPDDDAQPNGPRFRLHWILQMLVTETPLREKLSLFWHDHFAVLDEDVAHGLSMLDYMQKVRHNPAGKFRDILQRMTLSTAVMRELNVEMYTKAKPNENFARELLELYTMGEGNYTEKDIMEIARAMTGWAYMDVYWRLGERNDERLTNMVRHDTPAIFYFFAPDAHIEGKKTVLGKEVDTFEDVLDMLSDHPGTAKYISTKLWEWFAYADPEPKVVERLAGRFLKSKGDIQAVLLEMTETPEFWSEKCYRKQIKNPIEYMVGICRAMNAQELALERFNEGSFNEPIQESLANEIGGLGYRFGVTGMDIFYPPNVAGWDWGNAWISTNTLLRRREFRGIMTYYKTQEDGKDVWLPDKPTLYMINEIKARNPQDVDGIVNAFLTVFDCPLPPDKHVVLKKHFEDKGGIGAIQNERHFAWVCSTAINLLGSSPEFQLC